MYKIILGFSFLFVGCANYSINGTMCDQVRTDPLATVPTECRRYSEEEATRASDKETQILSPDDAIKFTK